MRLHTLIYGLCTAAVLLAPASVSAAGHGSWQGGGGHWQGHGGGSWHGGHHGHSHGHVGVFIGVPLAAPHYYYPSPYYYAAPPVFYADPPVYIEQQPVQQQPAQLPDGWWYYCRSTNAYYPNAASCSEPWEKVAPGPQQ